MKITYDLDVLPERPRRNNKREDVLAVIAFLAGKQKNMRIEYDDPKECKRRYEAIRNYRRTANIEEVFDLFRAGNSVYIIRTKKPRSQEKAAPSGRNTESGKQAALQPRNPKEEKR